MSSTRLAAAKKAVPEVPHLRNLHAHRVPGGSAEGY